MKSFFLSLLLSVSLPVLAKSDSPFGLFQVDSSHSLVCLSGDHDPLTGVIDIKEQFPESRFRLETGNSVFDSTEVTGDLSHFQVKGVVTKEGESKEVTLDGTYFGLNEPDEGHERIVMKLVKGECTTSVFATKPKTAATELYKTVQEIVE